MSLKPVGQRNVDRDARFLQLALYPGCLGIVLGAFVGGMTSGSPLLGALIGFIAVPLVAGTFYQLFAGTATAAITHAILPESRGGVGVPYSHIETLEAKGDIAGALAAWEEAIAASPDAIAARVNAADLHARKGNNPQRAAELFRAVQIHAKAPDETQRYVRQRLIDLYLGPLNDEGRALIELRKVADRWKGTPEGEGARRAIARIKGL